MRSENIKLKIVLPQKVLPVEEAERVIVPAVNGMLTVIPGRAPTTLLLKNGVVEVLDEDDIAVKKYFIQGGVANIAADECVVTTEKAINSVEISKEQAQERKYHRHKELKELKTAFPDMPEEETDCDSEFYEFIYQYLSEHPNEAGDNDE